MFGKKNREIQDLRWVAHSLEKTVEELKEECRRLEIENAKLRDEINHADVNPCVGCQYYNKPWHGIVSPCANCPKKSNFTGDYVTVTSTSVNVGKE